jgi:hypothetical protein
MLRPVIKRRTLQNASGEVDPGDYVLSRFVKGLSSGHDCARQGFFVAFVEHLRRVGEDEGIVEKVLELVEKHLAHAGSKSVSIALKLCMTLISQINTVHFFRRRATIFVDSSSPSGAS